MRSLRRRERTTAVVWRQVRLSPCLLHGVGDQFSVGEDKILVVLRFASIAIWLAKMKHGAVGGIRAVIVAGKLDVERLAVEKLHACPLGPRRLPAFTVLIARV